MSSKNQFFSDDKSNNTTSYLSAYLGASKMDEQSSDRHAYMSYPLHSSSSSNNNNRSNSRRGHQASPGSMVVTLIPRRLRKLTNYYINTAANDCNSCGCCCGATNVSPAGTSRSRFLFMCVAVYFVNVLLFLGAIATYVKITQMTDPSSSQADAMAIFATFQNSNNNRVMLSMNGRPMRHRPVGDKIDDGMMVDYEFVDDSEYDGYDHDDSLQQVKRSRSSHSKRQQQLRQRQVLKQRKAFIERKFAPGKLPHYYNQTGYVLFGKSDFFKFSSRLSTSLVYRLPLEDRVKRMFPDEAGENVLQALAPALTFADDKVKVFQRLWMSQNERAHIQRKPLLNTMVENYVLHRTLTPDYEPIEEASILPIPVTTNCVELFTYKTDGPMDARTFIINGTTYLSFHMWHIDLEFKGPRARMFLWNEKTKQLSKMKIANFTMLWTEINWVPLVVNGSLYFTYTFDPLRVLHCPDLTTHPLIWCHMVYQATLSPQHEFNEWVDAFRGGSPWVHYQGSYFISFAHTHFQYIKERISNETFIEGGIYSANLAVLKVIPATKTSDIAFRIIYVSEPIMINRKLLSSGDITRAQIIMWPFVFPVGTILWNGDVADIGAHINDSRGYIIRITGLQALMRRVIDADQRNVASSDGRPIDESSEAAQPDFGLVHKLTRESLIHMRDIETTENFP